MHDELRKRAADALVDEARNYAALARAQLEEAANLNSFHGVATASARHHLLRAVAELDALLNKRGAA